jgi:hypothetical protein
MTATEEKWASRIAAWKSSGTSQREFAAEGGYAVTTFRYWSWRLRTKMPAKAVATSARISMARVVRLPSKGEADTALVVELEAGSRIARVVVRRGFDGELLRDVVSALTGAR